MAGTEEDEVPVQTQLRAFQLAITDSVNNALERFDQGLASVVDRIEALEIRIPPAVHDEHEDDHQQDEQATREEQQRHRFERNRQGMGGNNNRPRPNHNDNNTDPFAKVKIFYSCFPWCL